MLVAFFTSCSDNSSNENSDDNSKLVSQKENKRTPDSKYLRWVGDSEYQTGIDDSTFKPCYGEYRVKQYFNYGNGLVYEGEKTALVNIFKEKFQSVDTAKSGFIRIRFIVNCEGKTGRFRLTSSDKNFQPAQFAACITDQLMTITKSLDGWLPLPDTTSPEDYYQYLVFKIEDGRLTEIMP